jgi:hypothetical protein
LQVSTSVEHGHLVPANRDGVKASPDDVISGRQQLRQLGSRAPHVSREVRHVLGALGSGEDTAGLSLAQQP